MRVKPIKVKLTIAIPTWNREHELRRCLDFFYKDYSTLSQADQSKIELIVSNNQSSDNTRQVLEDFKKKLIANYFYVVQKKNIGYDANWFFCFKEAKGEFVLILGDDDVILPGFLKAFLNKINFENNISLIGLKSFGYDKNPIIERPQTKNAIKYINNELDFLKQTKIGIGFISSVIINKSHIPNIDIYKQYIGTTIIQLSVILDTLVRGKCFAFMDSFYIAAHRHGPANICFIDSLVIQVDKFLLAYKRNGLSQKFINLYHRILVTDFIPLEIVRYKKYRPHFSQGYQLKLLKFYKSNFLFYIFCLPVLLTPKPFIFLIYPVVLLGKILNGNFYRVFYQVINTFKSWAKII